MAKTKTPTELSSKEALFNLLQTTECKYLAAIQKGYERYPKYKNGKVRWIEKPNDELKQILRLFEDYLQIVIHCPIYCMAGFKKQNNIKNAKRHRFKREVLTLDISHYFPNTKERYVRNFYKTFFETNEEVTDLLVRLTTYNGYLPTGAPTSILLAFCSHKEIFDKIFHKMQALDVDMTIYVDDITLSTRKHIGNWVIEYIDRLLRTHGLHLKKSKTKRYGYKYAVITGIHIAQSGKLSAPFKIGHSVINDIKEKKISEMSELELMTIEGKMNYINQFQKCDFWNIRKKIDQRYIELSKKKQQSQNVQPVKPEGENKMLNKFFPFLSTTKQEIDNDYLTLNDIVNQIIKDTNNSFKELDDLIKAIEKSIKNQTILLEDLNRITIEIPVLIYYLTDVCQKLELKKELASFNLSASRSKKILDSKGTIQEREAQSIDSTKQEYVLMMAYKNASNIIGKKIENAIRVLDSVKKFQQSKVQEKLFP